MKQLLDSYIYSTNSCGEKTTVYLSPNTRRELICYEMFYNNCNEERKQHKLSIKTQYKANISMAKSIEYVYGWDQESLIVFAAQ